MASTLIGLMAVLPAWGCDTESTSPTPPPARYEAVTVQSSVGPEDLAGFCDVQAKKDVELPELRRIPNEDMRARWLNVWATWCKSCVDELPMIERWKSEHGFSVLYISADEDPDALGRFMKEHPNTPKSVEMAAPEELGAWMKTLGLDGGAGLPVHVFLDPSGRLACARAGAIGEHHLPIVQSLLH